MVFFFLMSVCCGFVVLVDALGPWVQDLIILLTRWKLNWDLMALEKVNIFFLRKKMNWLFLGIQFF